MTATEILRQLLDERGVECGWSDECNDQTWWIDSDRIYFAKGEGAQKTLMVLNLTPEQAIVATLGRGEHEQRIYDRCLERVGQLEAENDKLRELVADMFGWYIKSECSSCEYRLDCHKLDRACDYMREFVPSMVELGIEVDE